MKYKITNWNGKKDMTVKIHYYIGEFWMRIIFMKELKLNLEYQIK